MSDASTAKRNADGENANNTPAKRRPWANAVSFSEKTSGLMGLSRALKNRICRYCGEIFCSYKKNHFTDSTLASHINNGTCPFVKQNIQPGQDNLKCHLCGKKFPLSKTMNTSYLTHMREHNAPMQCIFCEEHVKLQDQLNHNRAHASQAFSKVRCKRCQGTFSTATNFFQHLTQEHRTGTPNMATFGNHISDSQKNRKLVMLALFLSKYIHV